MLLRWEALTPEQQRKFPSIPLDFVLELRSVTDDLKMLQEKMQEYRDAGMQLGWLLNSLPLHNLCFWLNVEILIP